MSKLSKKTRKRILKDASSFDVQMQSAVERVLGIPFSAIDRSKLSVDEDLGAVLYDGVAMFVFMNGELYDSEGTLLQTNKT